MKAVGTVVCKEVLETDYTKLYRIPFHMRSPSALIYPEYTSARSTPFVKVELRPTKNFCIGMAYEQMEEDTAQTVTIEMEVIVALIIYLNTLGKTSQKTLHDMARSVSYKGLTTPDPWVDIIDEALRPVRESRGQIE